VTDEELDIAVAECTEKSARGLGMFEQFTKLVFTLLGEMRTLETRVSTHSRDIDGLASEIELLKELAADNKNTNSQIIESLSLMNNALCPILNKNRKFDKFFSYMGWVGVGSVVFAVMLLIAIDPMIIVDLVSKKL
tara:strand:- start:6 stop:413 length:408 start_codon:yes stop_codon:yes gene_type:complete